MQSHLPWPYIQPCSKISYQTWYFSLRQALDVLRTSRPLTRLTVFRPPENRLDRLASSAASSNVSNNYSAEPTPNLSSGVVNRSYSCNINQVYIMLLCQYLLAISRIQTRIHLIKDSNVYNIGSWRDSCLSIENFWIFESQEVYLLMPYQAEHINFFGLNSRHENRTETNRNENRILPKLWI